MIPSNGKDGWNEIRMVEWGIRKDGKPYNTTGAGVLAETITQGQPIATDNGNIIMAIMNPQVFFCIQNSGGNYDWNRGTNTPEGNRTGLNNLWSLENTDQTLNGNVVIKTVYDPNPAGFKMPPSDAWTWFTVLGYSATTKSQWNVVSTTITTKKGYDFYLEGFKTGSTTSFYAASGGRGNGIGSLSNVGTNGHYWSATTPSNSSNAFHMEFSDISISPQVTTTPKSFGLSVRPMAEE